MRKIWSKVATIGIDSGDRNLNQRTFMLSNQINMMMLVAMVIYILILKILTFTDGRIFNIGSLRIILVLTVNVLVLVLAKYKRHNLARIILIFAPSAIFLLFPTFAGFVEEESFSYYPYAIVTFSIIPQLLLLPNKESYLYWFSFLYFFLLLVFIDRLLVEFMPENIKIVEVIEGFYLWYKIAHISIFLFINMSVYYLRVLNIRFEKRLNDTNKSLHNKTLELKEKNAMLDLQNEELRATLEQLKTSQKQLLQAEKMSTLGTLTAGVAHELNNPLNYIAGGLDLMKSKSPTDHEKGIDFDQKNVETAYTIIRDGLNKAISIAKSLLSFSYRGEPILVDTNINSIIDNTLLFLKAKFDNEIAIHKNYMLKKEIPAYPDKLHQLFLNIIDNAVFAIRNKNELNEEYIQIETNAISKNKNEYALIKITNSGPPIPSDIVAQIFEPFFTTKKLGEGTGLGLSISYNLVQEHKGFIDVFNMDEGVCFEIILPIS